MAKKSKEEQMIDDFKVLIDVCADFNQYGRNEFFRNFIIKRINDFKEYEDNGADDDALIYSLNGMASNYHYMTAFILKESRGRHYFHGSMFFCDVNFTEEEKKEYCKVARRVNKYIKNAKTLEDYGLFFDSVIEAVNELEIKPDLDRKKLIAEYLEEGEWLCPSNVDHGQYWNTINNLHSRMRKSENSSD